ncbi:hypothetical protein HXA34_13440 [Salipaludibacillus agaradhaerens]|jgi:chromosome segregation ATPase|uniref:hypothetical protein n=1 Tax=Salipaludibacillus agaradhaerens TaxID=76935 RepID=UPI00215174BD|nr:hypothetical protein [Salipaludibacillus agaradhaerens]MCR6107303.1 hypothetical protein [Salipaludibacillus agaradhaerens]MCR6111353.1 hypothetical protein [Bacillus sp. A301a_S52]MCR6119332.1 hypothetical protein [Salipaludibacillus agaradhaerens]
MTPKPPKDPVLLQQQVIYFKSELAKFKNKVKHYQNDYHYSLIEELKEKNRRLIEETQAKENQIGWLKTEEERLANENSQLRQELAEINQQFHTSDVHNEIDELKKENEHLKLSNEQLKKKLTMLEELKNTESSTSSSPHLQQIENQMDDVLEKSFAYEENLNAKMVLIQFLEGKLNALSEEIDTLTSSTQELSFDDEH